MYSPTPGTQYSYQLAQQLERLGLLHCFATGFAVGDDMAGNAGCQLHDGKKLLRHTVAIPGRKLFTLPLIEWKAVWQIKKVATSARKFPVPPF